MSHSRVRIMWLLGICLIVGWPIVSFAKDSPPSCAVDFVSYGQGTVVTPAQVIGLPAQRLILNHHDPDNNSLELSEVSPAPTLYLVTGDKVDLVTKCKAYFYVVFKGVNRVSIGWVDSSRIRTIGQPHVVPPVSEQDTCKAFAMQLTGRGGISAQITARRLDGPYAQVKFGSGQDGYSDRYISRLKIGDRVVTATKMSTFNSCESMLVEVWPNDLLIDDSANNHVSRHPNNRNGLIFSEYLVDFLGSPMIEGFGIYNKRDYLMSIDANGNIDPVCEATLKARSKPEVVTAQYGSVCKALAAGQGAPVALRPPSSGQSIAFSNYGDDENPADASSVKDVGNVEAKKRLNLHFYSPSANTGISLEKTGLADLNNTGRERPVGIVTYKRSWPGRCDEKAYLEVPVILDKSGVADPTSSINEPVYRTLGNSRTGDNEPSDTTYTRLVRYAGKTYVETSSISDTAFEQAWEINPSGIHSICGFNAYYFDVKPVFPAAAEPRADRQSP